MTVHSLSQALEDSAALATLAENAGLSMQQTRAVLAWLAEMPAQQVVRMTKAAQADRVRRVNRQGRKR